MSDFEKQKDQLHEAVLDSKRQETEQLFISQLMSSMEKNGKIKYNPEEKKALEQQAKTTAPSGE